MVARFDVPWTPNVPRWHACTCGKCRRGMCHRSQAIGQQPRSKVVDPRSELLSLHPALDRALCTEKFLGELCYGIAIEPFTRNDVEVSRAFVLTKMGDH